MHKIKIKPDDTKMNQGNLFMAFVGLFRPFWLFGFLAFLALCTKVDKIEEFNNSGNLQMHLMTFAAL
jgi:hypothetical protein